MQIVITLAALAALVLVFESWAASFDSSVTEPATTAEPAESAALESRARDRAR